MCLPEAGAAFVDRHLAHVAHRVSFTQLKRLVEEATEAALDSDVDGCIARVDNTRSPVWADRVRDWCANHDVHVTVRPVKDLAEHIHVEAYEIPGRLRVEREMVDHHCVFSWCTRPARSCDTDHITPHDSGGTTCSHNTAPLCRGHPAAGGVIGMSIWLSSRAADNSVVDLVHGVDRINRTVS